MEISAIREHLFLSTLSLRRATINNLLLETAEMISIHALLAESDEISHFSPYC